MEEKLRRLMKHEGINSTRLAEILGIQASGISHIMSGRNKPSFDFLLKLLQRFPQINPDWLMLDKGPMYRDEIKKGAGSSSGVGVGVNTTAASVGSEVLERTMPSGPGIGAGTAGVLAATVGSRAGTVSTGGPGGNGRAVPSTASEGSVGGGNRSFFEPDNNDIIPMGRTANSNSADGLHGVGQSGRHDGGMPSAETMEQRQHGIQRPAGANDGVGIATGFGTGGGFARTASIERIVVFFRDKTFAEYRPE